MEQSKRNTRQCQDGFTLIELLIVVAIIGVLAAVAVPRYQDYVTRSEVTSALATIRGAQTPAELAIQEGNELSLDSDEDGFIGIPSSNELGTITVRQTTTEGDATDAYVRFTFDGDEASSRLSDGDDDGYIQIIRGADGWVCQANVDEAFVPKGCVGV